MNTSELEDELLKHGFQGLFLYGSKSYASEIWRNGENLLVIEEIIKSKSASLIAKFLAAELIKNFNVEIKESLIESLVDAYAFALKNSSQERSNIMQLNGNMWGEIFSDGDSGQLGSMLISFGEMAVSDLENLLNDEGVINYEGSREAYIGNEYNCRVKDFSAYYISKIKNIPFEFHEKVKDRDEEIERLKKQL